jgi:nucleoid-associated protein YgaU
LNRPLLVGIVGGLIVAAAIILTFFIDREPDRPVQQQVTAPANGPREPSAPPMPAKPALPGSDAASTATPGPAKRAADPSASGSATPGVSTAGQPSAAPSAPGAPSFDVVRVSPDGDTVIAGRAPPDAEIEVRIGETVIGRVKADKRGEWVLVPQKPIPPGTHELSVIARLPDGTTQTGTQTVVVVVPAPGRDVAGRPATAETGTGSLAIALPTKKGDAPVVLQTPGGVASGEVSLNAIDYGADGKDLALSGHAPPGAQVRVYIDNAFVGAATADSKGVWTLRPEVDVAPGLHRLRVDLTGPGGKVIARVELPFSRAAPLRDLAPGAVVFVQPGNSLWRLARASYGEGLRYTEIYEANRDQIRNPDLIYPGQVFVLPKLN